MRTHDDLAAAFALIEASVDDYAERTEPGPAHVADLRSAARRRAPHGRRWVTVAGSIVAAASAAALLVALSVGGFSGSEPALSDGDRPSGLDSDGRSLPFVLAQGSGLQVIGITSSATGRTAELADRSTHLSASFSEPGQDARITPGLEAVSLGDRQGYYDDGSLAALTPTSPAAQPSLGTPGFSTTPAVVWEYAPSAFAVVTGFDAESPPARAVLLQAARDLHPAASAPLDLSFRLARGGSLGTLTRIIATSRWTDAVQPPYTFLPDATLCQADYTLPVGGNGVEVTVERGVFGQGGRGSGVDVTVDGHQARWDERLRQLVVTVDGDVHVRVAEANFTGRYTLSLPELEQIFRLVTLASDVADPTTWFPAEQGLP